LSVTGPPMKRADSSRPGSAGQCSRSRRGKAAHDRLRDDARRRDVARGQWSFHVIGGQNSTWRRRRRARWPLRRSDGVVRDGLECAARPDRTSPVPRADGRDVRRQRRIYGRSPRRVIGPPGDHGATCARRAFEDWPSRPNPYAALLSPFALNAAPRPRSRERDGPIFTTRAARSRPWSPGWAITRRGSCRTIRRWRRTSRPSRAAREVGRTSGTLEPSRTTPSLRRSGHLARRRRRHVDSARRFTWKLHCPRATSRRRASSRSRSCARFPSTPIESTARLIRDAKNPLFFIGGPVTDKRGLLERNSPRRKGRRQGDVRAVPALHAA